MIAISFIGWINEHPLRWLALGILILALLAGWAIGRTPKSKVEHKDSNFE